MNFRHAERKPWSRTPKAATPLRAIPSVDKLLRLLPPVNLPRPALVSIIRRELNSLRARGALQNGIDVPARVTSAVSAFCSSRLQPLINGTGIIIHTNLGRAPLATEAIAALTAVAEDYNNLEYDLLTGERGARAPMLEHNLALLCGAEASTVVNNCAAALVLVLKHFTSRKPEVIVSRGELPQIGGGFRIPDILEASGARLREIGTTNQTNLEDYARAISSETGAILKVHRSNFRMEGFVASPPSSAISALAQEQGIPFVEDLGSGAVVGTEKIPGLEHEPTPAEVLGCGVDLVTFSGDKLLGGPQAGIIAGKRDLITALRREPFFRALRCDKLILSALEATVNVYLHGNPWEKIPVLMLLNTSLDDLKARAAKILDQLAGLPLQARVCLGEGQVGGGTLPTSKVPSPVIEIVPDGISLPHFASQLRQSSPPVVGVISGGAYQIHLRTMYGRQDGLLVEAIKKGVSNGHRNGH